MSLSSLSSSLLSRFPSLTAREADVLSRVAQGWTNAQIASDLGTTEKTVKNVLLPVPFKVGMADDDRGGSLRVRLALTVHGIAAVAPTL